MVTNASCLFIVGSGRSGNTLLRRLLMEHYRIYIPPETYVLGPVIKAWRRRRLLGLRNAVSKTLSEFQHHPEFRWFPVRNLDDFAERMLSKPRQEVNLSSLLSCLYCYFGQTAGVEFDTWGDKTPLNTFYLKDINRVFPEARFVFICRDAADVVASYVKAGIYDNLERAAQRWVESNQLMLSFQQQFPNRVYRVKYEKLVLDQASVLEGLGGFLQLERRREPMPKQLLKGVLGDVGNVPHHDKVLRDVDGKSIGKGRESLAGFDLLSLSGTLDPTLKVLGYDVCEPASKSQKK